MIPTLERVLFLKSVGLFAGLTSEELAPVAAIAVEERREAGEDILREGEMGDSLYLVVEGRVRVHRGGETLAVLSERESLGEMALLDPAPRSATATAETDVTLLEISEEDFRELLEEKQRLSLGLLQVLTRRLRAQGPPGR
ncbi:MAG: cyclic nucleotide-binding domain-containing protein [Deltaproteobacteria bacterium]